MVTTSVLSFSDKKSCFRFAVKKKKSVTQQTLGKQWWRTDPTGKMAE